MVETTELEARLTMAFTKTMQKAVWLGITVIGAVAGVLLRYPVVMAQAPQVKPFTAQRTLGDVTAELSVDLVQEPERFTQYQNTRIKITRQGKTVFDQAIADHPVTQGLDEQWVTVALEFRDTTEEMILRDLDGDKEPELMVNFYSGGAHCCSSSAIYRYTPQTNTYNPMVHFWGNGGGANLKDVNNDGKLEFISRDDRFAYAFGSYAGSGYPIQIWNYGNGRMLDVTKQYRQLVYNNAYYWWQAFQERQREQDTLEYGKGPLAAYVADKYLIGEGKDSWERAQKAYYGDDKAQFFQNLRKFLQETGYIAK
jgi:hypothetical protein